MFHRSLSVWFLILMGWLSTSAVFAADPSVAETPKPVPASPLSPEESLKHFQIDPDCRIELVAAEPDVSAPVSIAFDERGQLWVVEMHDYPNGPAPGEPGKSRIRVLTDEDGDGKYSNPRVFVDQLLFANGLMHWDGGVLVTTDGKLIYFKDTDNDGKSDLREVWFEGFATENPQLRCNHPTFGPDNWIYVANGLRNGKVRAVRPKWPKPAPEGAKLGEPVDISGRDFRFNPFTGECEAVSGYGQFGLTFDDEGNRYVCSNRNPCMKIIIEERHLKLNPNLAVPSVVEDVSPAGEQSKLYPISRAWTTSNLHAGQFSAACGLIFYRGTALPKKFYNQSFTCDPTGNLVHFNNEAYNEAKREFLASDETWFRPVNTAMGPDGSLYIVDMYRAVIEHPEYMPTELKSRPDLAIGAERGRIWRVFQLQPGNWFARTRWKLPNDSQEAAKLLTHSNGWHRDTAHRLLVESRSAEAEKAMREILIGKTEYGAVLALRVLDGLGRVTSRDLTEIIRRVPLVLEPIVPGTGQAFSMGSTPLTLEAIRIAETVISQDGELAASLLDLAEAPYIPPDEIHLTLGQLKDRERERRIKLGVRMLSMIMDSSQFTKDHPREADEKKASRLMRKNTAMRVAAGEGAFLADIVRQSLTHPLSTQAGPLPSLLIQSAARGATEDELGPLFRQLVLTHDIVGVLVMADTMKSRGLTVQQIVSQSTEIRGEWTEFLADQVKICSSVTIPEDRRMSTLPCLKYAPSDQSETVLRKILESNESTNVCQVALEVATTLPDPIASDLLMLNFTQRTPALRSTIISGLLTSEPRITKLLDLVESNQVSFLEIGQTRLASLQQVKNPEIQARLQKLIAANAPADRSKVLEEYQAALTHEHDPLRGRELFAKNCAICHKIGDLGVDVAPNISDSRVKTHAQLLTDILDPNRAIDNNYFSYTLVDTSGKVSTGIISSETSSSVTMKQPEGKTITVLRTDIEQLKPNGVSLMPVGFEKQLSVAQLADVISFIKNWRYLDGQVPKEVIK